MKVKTERKVEEQILSSTSSTVASPSQVKNIDEIRFYVRDLCFKIEELENTFEYVPASSYDLLAKYNTLQNSTEKSFNTIL
jgi:hypothetical protein